MNGDALESGDSGGFQASEKYDSAHALGEVIATAIVTAAITPFVQTLVKKAAEDSYAAVRGWLNGMFRDAKTKRIPPGRRHRALLIVQEPDAEFSSQICMPTDVSSRAIDALAGLDVEAALAQAKHGKAARIRIYWDEQAGIWRVDQ